MTAPKDFIKGRGRSKGTGPGMMTVDMIPGIPPRAIGIMTAMVGVTPPPIPPNP